MNFKVATVIRSVISKKIWKCTSNRLYVKIPVARSCYLYQIKWQLDHVQETYPKFGKITGCTKFFLECNKVIIILGHVILF